MGKGVSGFVGGVGGRKFEVICFSKIRQETFHVTWNTYLSSLSVSLRCFGVISCPPIRPKQTAALYYSSDETN